jgi:hypothetical protein
MSVCNTPCTNPHRRLEQAPLLKIGLIANDSLRVEPHATPLKVQPIDETRNNPSLPMRISGPRSVRMLGRPGDASHRLLIAKTRPGMCFAPSAGRFRVARRALRGVAMSLGTILIIILIIFLLAASRAVSAATAMASAIPAWGSVGVILIVLLILVLLGKL